MTRTQKQALRTRMAVGASAVAVAATVWGVTALVARDDHTARPQDNASRQDGGSRRGEADGGPDEGGTGGAAT
ncbi:hypothetical protein ACFXPI_38995, partial [Streptomyces sp. NPDC059104]